MPPIRQPPLTINTNNKPMKTERTHEENQERAYIAASRRSDRSLEARMESARRASEIHKKRTGRSLRVSERDVVNEEMYEEEDDDLPFQYRRLTAHINAGGMDFNRRLSDYLTQHVAIRNALGQAVKASYAQDPNSPNFNPNAQHQTPLQMYAQQQAIQNSANSGSMPPSMMQSSPTSYRHSPYPTTNDQRGNNSQSRSASLSTISSPTDQSKTPPQSRPTNTLNHRRMSAPTKTDENQDSNQNSHQQAQRNDTSSSMPTLGGMNSEFTSGFLDLSAAIPPQDHLSDLLSTNLPPETQMFFPNGFDMNNFINNGSGVPNSLNSQVNAQKTTSSPFYSYKPNANLPMRNGARNNTTNNAQNDGMNSTLAPGALDSKSEAEGNNNNNDGSWPDLASMNGTSNFAYPLDYSYGGKHGPGFGDESSAGGMLFDESDGNTPGGDDWANQFLEFNPGWDEEGAQEAS